MKSFLLARSRATPAELAAALWSFFYFFALLAGYYVLRPIRDEMGMQLGQGVLHQMFTAVFLTMVVLVPVYGWLNRVVARRTLLPWLYAFFILNLVGFYAVMEASGEQSPLVARVFFVWVSVFNLFVISVFWSFMADLFDTEQARRLYGFVSAGGTLGALTGPLITAGLVTTLGPKRLVLVSAALLGLAIVAIFRLRAWAQQVGARGQATNSQADDGEHQKLQGGVWSGLVDAVREPYLRGICLFLLGYSLLSTFLYFQGAELVPKTITDSGERTQLLAQVDWVVNVLALLLQLFAFRQLIGRLGIRFVLAVMPVISIVGYALLAAFPALGVLVAFGVLRRAGEYAVTKPGRETLFNVLPPEQKYKAKNVIDTLVHRTGDTASGWVFAGLRGVGFTSQQISWLAVPIAAGWLWVALRLGRRAQALQERASPHP